MNILQKICLRDKGSRKIFSLFLCLCTLITACGETLEPEEVLVIDSAYLGITTTTKLQTMDADPPIPYPIEVEDEVKIRVGEVMDTYEDFNWHSIFPSAFSISNPEIVEGEGTICVIGEKAFSVLGESPGSCSLKFPSTNNGIEGFIFLTITVIGG